MLELIERLEKAEAGSRELDGAVWYAAFEPDVEHGCLHVEQTEQGPREVLTCELGSKWADDVGPYTTSLDAALALAERVLPDHDWSVGCLPVSDDADHEEHHHFGALLYSRYTKPYDALGHGATPALALCIAILRALRTTEQHSPAQQMKED